MDEIKTPAGSGEASGGEEAKIVATICARYQNAPSALLEILHDVQASLGQVGETMQTSIAACLNITRAEVHGVTSFYDDFRPEAAPDMIVRICRGEACQSMGAENLFSVINDKVGDLKHVGVEAVFCLGNCALAPAASVGGILHGRVEKDSLMALVEHATQTNEVSK